MWTIRSLYRHWRNSMKNKAAIIAEQLEQNVSVSEVLDTNGFTTPFQLGCFMQQEGYRFVVSTHRYVYDPAQRKEQVEKPKVEESLHDQLTEARLLEGLDKQVTALKELLDGAFPIRLKETTQRQLVKYCQQHNLSVDDFVEGLLVEWLAEYGKKG